MTKNTLNKTKKATAVFSAVLMVAAVLVVPMDAQAATLNVDLDANPNIGAAPLNDVDISANVSGTATGPITYKFDCTNNGTWDHQVTTTDTSHTASNLCDYTNAGSYQVKAVVSRGGLVFTGYLAVVAEEAQEKSLFVNISADPNQGFAPLNDVDVTAAVSGTATGPITYKFDCTDNGTWEHTVTTNNTTYTAGNLCDYPNSGSYLARVFVARDGLTFSGTATIVVDDVPTPVMTIDKTVGVEFANPGGTVPYTIVVRNTGTVEARNVEVNDTLPSGLTHSDTNSTTKEWNFSTVAAGSSRTISFNVNVGENVNAGFITNTATVDADKINPVSDSATLEIRGAVLGEEAKPNLGISKTANKEFVNQGGSVAYTITVTNGGDASATNITITDTLPADFTAENGNTTVTFNVSSLAPGASVQKSFIANVSSSAALGDHTNIVRATAENFPQTIEASHTVEVRQGAVLGDTGVSIGALMLWIGTAGMLGIGGYEINRRRQEKLFWSKV